MLRSSPKGPLSPSICLSMVLTQVLLLCSQIHPCALRYTTVLSDTPIHQCAPRSTNVLPDTPMCSQIHHCSQTHHCALDIPMCSWIYHCALRHTTVLSDTPLCTQIHHCAPRYTTIRQTGPQSQRCTNSQQRTGNLHIPARHYGLPQTSLNDCITHNCCNTSHRHIVMKN